MSKDVLHPSGARPRGAVAFRAAVITTGASGLVAQMSLLREFLIVAAGNEMTIGLILANWLVIEAAGAVLGGRLSERWFGGGRLSEESGGPEAPDGEGAGEAPPIHRQHARKALYALTVGLFCLSLPAALYGIRVLKPVLGLSVGEIPGLGVVFLSSFLLLLPTSLTHGALFPIAYGAAGRSGRAGDSPIGRLYLLDTAGTLIGGLLWTWVLIRYLHSFEIAVVVVAVNTATCTALLLAGGAAGRSEGLLGFTAASVSGVLLVAAGAMLATGGAERAHAASIARGWRGQNVVEYRNSVHGNVTVVENEGQYSFFTDGTLALLTPFPDTAHVKTYAHIPLTVHPDPERVLLIGGGPGGLIAEMLKHPGLDRIDYAELDPLLIEALRRHPTELTEAELEAPRVSVELTDGRSHLMHTPERYDVILSMLTDPSDLQTNRYFTEEFFRLARRRLTETGIVVVRLPGVVGYSHPSLTDLVSSLHLSLASVFPHIRVFPREGDTMAIASASSAVMSYDVEVLQARLSTRGLRGQVELPWEIARVLHAGWQEWYLDLAARGTARPNRDFTPYGVFGSLSYWSSLNAPAVVPLLHGLGRARPWMVCGVLLVAALVIVVVRLGRGPSDGLGSGLCVFGTGAAGMLFSLSVIFSFQSLFGLLFSWIGVLTAVFMAGAALGAALMSRRLAAGPMTGHLSGGPKLSREMAISELSVLAAAVLLPLIIPLWAFLLERSAALGLLKAAFLLLPVGCGMVTGAQFPLAGRLREERIGRRTQTAGSLYAADLAGGWLGGMLGGVFLLPVLGLAGTGLTVAFLKVLTLSHLGASLRVRSKRA